MDNNIPSTVDPSLHGRENTSRDPEVVVEPVPLLNGGPPTSQQVVVTPIPTTETITSTTAPTEPIFTEAVSISSTPPGNSMGIAERVPLTEPICLTAEDPQIRCTVCNTIDCMIHNPRHRYCMDCGQRLLGPHVCSNRMECTTISRPQNTIRTDEIQPMGPEYNNSEILLPRHYEPNTEVLEDRISGNNPLINRETITRQMPPSSVPSETCCHDLPTYEETVTPGPDLPTSMRIVPNIQDILHHIDYSSDPNEARIHFEILSPTRPSRSRHRNVNTRRERWRYPSTIHDHIYCDEIEIRPPSCRMINYIPPRTCIRHHHHQASGRDDGSSPGDEADPVSAGSSNR